MLCSKARTAVLLRGRLRLFATLRPDLTLICTPSLVLRVCDAALLVCRWHFALDEPVSHPSSGGPLFIGSLPARQPDAYYALLPMRVPKMTKVRCGAHSTRTEVVACREGHWRWWSWQRAQCSYI